eukprot:CAMPEP_0206032904 /NCGR_PEP_ID=MMETSP1466-20131121/284_1 /ASSEMBLY_ACC=CAM_ASM_001126 /TAXON_ID=44452 /ORGANISM="Pavlova gyrans, Strain CCMP608" /LENGTH=437 /DNA_ID=CAMNT_0053407061 /DNA_START=104 /DNA_END=1418 /DNA_ORIENTATION=+
MVLAYILVHAGAIGMQSPASAATTARKTRNSSCPSWPSNLSSSCVAALHFSSDHRVAYQPASYLELETYRRRLFNELYASEEWATWEGQTQHLLYENAKLNAVRRGHRLPENALQTSLQAQVSGGRPQRAGYCISGQAERLEISSKVKHVFLPNAGKYTIDAVFAVAPPGTAHFVNRNTDTGVRVAWTEAAIRAHVEQHLAGGKLIVDMSAQWYLPLLRQHYVDMGEKFKNAERKREERARSHVRQWWSMWRCHGHFVRLEEENSQQYDVLVKMRDDSVFLLDFNIFSLDVQRNEAVFKSCLGWFGLNDKVIVVHGSVEHEFFARHLLDWYSDTAFEKLSRFLKVGSPESYTKALMLVHGVKVRAVGPLAMPAITAESKTPQAECASPRPVSNSATEPIAYHRIAQPGATWHACCAAARVYMIPGLSVFTRCFMRIY